MITQALIRKAGKLPAGYRRQSEVSYQGAFQQWITVTEMTTQTYGQSNAYFKTENGETEEISRESYINHVLASVGKR